MDLKSLIITELAPLCNLVVMLCLLGMAILNLAVLQAWLPYFNLEVMIGILEKKDVIIQLDHAYVLL